MLPFHIHAGALTTFMGKGTLCRWRPSATHTWPPCFSRNTCTTSRSPYFLKDFIRSSGNALYRRTTPTTCQRFCISGKPCCLNYLHASTSYLATFSVSLAPRLNAFPQTDYFRSDLLHEVQLRSASNRMDAHNLTVVISPNLVSSSNPMRDVMMCSVPNAPTLFDAARAASSTNLPQTTSLSTPPASSEGKATLGMVIKLCIQRYYEVFDEVLDRSEATSPTAAHGQEQEVEMFHPPHDPFDEMHSPTSSSLNNRDSALLDDEEIDDAMLVMPLGPPSRFSAGGSSSSGSGSAFRPQHRSTRSKDVAARSTHTTFGNGGGPPSAYATVNKARSTISIERGNTSRKGSIALGRGGTVRGKSTGSGVQAISITAEGFFSAPDAPPMPPLPSQLQNDNGNGNGNGVAT